MLKIAASRGPDDDEVVFPGRKMTRMAIIRMWKKQLSEMKAECAVSSLLHSSLVQQY